MDSADPHSDDQTHSFLLYAHKIVCDAAFIITSFPNVESFSVERILRQLYSVYHILSDLDDPWLTRGDLESLSNHVLETARPLYEFLKNPPTPSNNGKASYIFTGHRGRPRRRINLDRAIELHNLGCTWESISEALGVTRQTLYNHLRDAGLSTQRPAYTSISDDDLDETVSEIILSHPTAGSNVVSGHLEAKGIRVPITRVQESLRRVDPIGVFVR
ncbi:hypothetical protein VKT23_019092 [Stygiomarasmius scandens]